jgi:hypothetical protein
VNAGGLAKGQERVTRNGTMEHIAYIKNRWWIAGNKPIWQSRSDENPSLENQVVEVEIVMTKSSP